MVYVPRWCMHQSVCSTVVHAPDPEHGGDGELRILAVTDSGLATGASRAVPDSKRVLAKTNRRAYRREVSAPALMAHDGEKLKAARSSPLKDGIFWLGKCLGGTEREAVKDFIGKVLDRVDLRSQERSKGN